jgi:hypothetical protein
MNILKAIIQENKIIFEEIKVDLPSHLSSLKEKKI